MRALSLNARIPRSFPRPVSLDTYQLQRGHYDDPITYQINEGVQVIADEAHTLEIELMGYADKAYEFCDLSDEYIIANLYNDRQSLGFMPVRIRRNTTDILDYELLAKLVYLGVMHLNPHLHGHRVNVRTHTGVMFDHPILHPDDRQEPAMIVTPERFRQYEHTAFGWNVQEFEVI